MLDAARRPTLDGTRDLAAAMGRHAFAHATDALDLSPEDRRRAVAMQFDAVEEIEAAMRPLGDQLGADRAEAVRLAVLGGIKAQLVTLSLTAR